MIFSAVAGAAVQTNSDPLCSLTNAPSPLRSPFIQPESTRRMIQRLEQLRTAMNPIQVRFLSDQRATIMASMLDKITNAFEKAEWRLKLAANLIDAGQPDAALEQFKTIEDFIASSSQPPDDAWKAAFRIRKALALLRLGEQENCLLTHNADSCLLPLRPAAFHQLPRGSRGAV